MIYEGGPQNTGIYKKLCIYSYMFKLQSPSKYSPFDAMHLLRHFCHCSQQLLNLLILMLFSASAIFCFTSSTLTKCFHLRTFFIQGNKQSHWGEIGWIWRVKDGGHAFFGKKLQNTEHGIGRCLVNHPIMKWANTLKASSKKFSEAEHGLSQQCQLVHWYRCVPRTLT